MDTTRRIRRDQPFKGDLRSGSVPLLLYVRYARVTGFRTPPYGHAERVRHPFIWSGLRR